MATLGNTSIEASLYTLASALGGFENIAGQRVTATEDFVATRIVAYMAKNGAPNHNVKCALYEYDAGGNHVFIAETAVVSVGTAAWYKFAFSTFVQIRNGTEYIICAIGEAAPSRFVSLYYAASSGTGIEVAATYPTFPDPLTGVTGITHLFSIFVHGIAGLADGLHFGNETVQAVTASLENVINGGIETMGGADGVANKIVAYVEVAGFVGTDTVLLKAAIYSNAADPALIAESDELSIDPYNAHAGIVDESGWYVFPLSTPPSLSASTAYTIAIWATSEASGAVYGRVVLSGGSGMELDNETYGTWPDPMGNTNVPDWRMSVFVDYSLPAAGQPIRKRHGGIPGMINKPIFGRGF